VGAAAIVAGILTAGPPSVAVAADYFKSTGGLVTYIGILPAQIVRGHSRAHPEAKMHNGAPTGRDHYHLVVAVFDASSGVRIDDAQVTAKVGEPGLASVEKRLEPMPIAGAMSYGNYFPMTAPGPYRIDVRVGRQASGKTVEVTFTYSRPR
jgi:hypothetical protein